MSDTVQAVDERVLFGARNNIGTVVSNYDGVVDEEVERRLKDEPNTFADFPAWMFFAKVWYEDGRYHAFVKRHRAHVGTYEAPTVAELRTKVSDIWGYE